MGKPANREEVLRQIRDMPLEDREYIESELLRDGHERGRRSESPAARAELVRRADEAVAHPRRGISQEDSVARARAAAEAVRACKP